MDTQDTPTLAQWKATVRGDWNRWYISEQRDCNCEMCVAIRFVRAEREGGVSEQQRGMVKDMVTKRAEQAAFDSKNTPVLYQTTASCGMVQLHVLTSNCEQIVRKALFPEHRMVAADAPVPGSGVPRHAKPIFYPLVMFSDAEHYARGEKLSKFIKDNDLGEIVESPVRVNPNTLNKIRTWIWAPPAPNSLTEAQKKVLELAA